MLFALLSATLLGLAPVDRPAIAQTRSASAAVHFDIAPGPLADGLRELARQSNVQILFDPRVTNGRPTAAVRGRMTPEVALARMLAGSGLTVDRTSGGVLLVRPQAMIAASPEIEAPIELDDVVVTGTLLRGVDGPSPVLTITRRDAGRRGYSVAESLRTLPQSFGGAGNEAALQNGADGSATNTSFASGVNLRGLGSDATLVLVNGRRLGGAGAKADFVDVSLVPVIAMDRVEVLLDGASALYGSDAVAGVVNIILKTRHEGMEARLQAGAIPDGPSSDVGFGGLTGWSWSGGGAVLAYEYHDREALPVSERDRAGDADLRRFGGGDRRLYYSRPGTLLIWNAANGVFAPAWAIPATQDGADLVAEDFRPGPNLENQRAGLNVLPRQSRHSVFAAVHQRMDDRLTLSAEALYGRRRWVTTAPAAAVILTVDARNPWFVSPTGASSHQIAYAFHDDLGSPRLTGVTEGLSVSASAELEAGDWRLTGHVSHARNESRGRTLGQLNAVHLEEALGTISDNPLTFWLAARDGYFNPFGDGGANTAELLDFLRAGWTRSGETAAVTSAHARLEGPLVRLASGEVRLAVGGEIRGESQSGRLASFVSSAAPVETASPPATRAVASLFAEIRVPLIANRVSDGQGGLEVSAALRHEDHDDIGAASTPKIGSRWSLGHGFAVKGSVGRSFRTPALSELGAAPLISASLLPRGDAAVPALILYGGNPRLRAERAVSRTLGLDWAAPDGRDLRLGVAWFETRFDRRIGRPAFDDILGALDDAAFEPFVRLVSPRSNATDHALVEGLLARPETLGGGRFAAENYGAVVDARYVNTGALEVEGFDLRARYAFASGPHDFRLSAAATRLLRYDTRATSAADMIRRLDTPNHPLGLRARLDLEWSHVDGWEAGLAVNHAGGYRDVEGRPIRSWSTIDLEFGRRFPLRTGGEVSVRLAIRNLFDEDPPFHDAPHGLAYDAANADVLGRQLSLQLSRVW